MNQVLTGNERYNTIFQSDQDRGVTCDEVKLQIDDKFFTAADIMNKSVENECNKSRIG